MLRDLRERIVHAGLNSGRQIERLEQHFHAHISRQIAPDQRIHPRRQLPIVRGVICALRVADRKYMAQRDLGILILDFHYTTQQRAENGEATVAFDLVVLLEEAKEVLVMADFVCTDIVRQLLENRVVRALIDCPIQRGRPGFNDTTRDHFQRTRFSKSSTEQVSEYSAKKFLNAVSQSNSGHT